MLREALQEVMDLQSFFSAANTLPMQRRSNLIRRVIGDGTASEQAEKSDSRSALPAEPTTECKRRRGSARFSRL